MCEGAEALSSELGCEELFGKNLPGFLRKLEYYWLSRNISDPAYAGNSPYELQESPRD